MKIVVDTNILISALIKKGISRSLIVNSKDQLILPEYSLIELKKYEKEIIKKAKFSKEELKRLIRLLLKYFTIVPSKFPKGISAFSKKIMDKIDEKDTIFIAIAIYYDAAIWSDDKHFQRQKEVKIFTTKERFELIK